MRLLIAIFWLALATPANALFVDPNGSDENDCSSPAKACASIQRAVDKVPFAETKDIWLAAGEYRISETINVFYWRGMSIHGPRDDQGRCVAPGAKIIGVRQGIAAFLVQDFALLSASCLSIEAGPGVSSMAAFSARQAAILDFGPDIRFGRLSIYVSLADRSMASCVGKIYLDGD